MAKVNAPNKQYSGVSAGVTFVMGVGECSDPYLLSWFGSRGYEVEDMEPDAGQGDGGPKTDESGKVQEDADNSNDGDSEFDSMSDEEIKAYVEEKGIDIGQATSRNGILKKILEVEKE
ncbi:hypothetical protein ACP8HI_04460 [Paenibacillus sp. FA6]|uniref:hypothetical protein n=1 Tax=Paenibacillus sp. FA6 TaxID=3413029 RepID=UPI003F655484